MTFNDSAPLYERKIIMGKPCHRFTPSSAWIEDTTFDKPTQSEEQLATLVDATIVGKGVIPAKEWIDSLKK